MNQDEITRYITNTFSDVRVVPALGNIFFFQDPERMFPFVTIVANDSYDTFSNLNRDGIFRLNIGVGKKSFHALFGPERPAQRAFDFTALDRIMPHPVYGNMYWLCVLNPTERTFEQLKPLLAEAFQLSVVRSHKQAAPTGRGETGGS